MEQRKRGRPKSLDREHVLNTAMLAIWESGLPYVSINTICKLSEVSKPALYREFGNEDKLLAATLQHYFSLVLVPAYQVLDTDDSAPLTLDKLINLFVDRDAGTFPRGCLFVKMRQNRLQVGPETRKMIDQTSNKTLGFFKSWITASKKTGKMTSTIQTDALARFLEAQLTNAMAREARGADTHDTKEILGLALAGVH